MIYNFLLIVLPILGIGLIAAIAVNVVQTGFLFSTKAMQPQMSRLNPMEGMKRLFSARVLFDLLKNTGKIVLVGLIIYNAIRTNLDNNVFPLLMTTNYRGAILEIADIIFNTATQILLVLAVLAAIDFFYQRQKFEKDLRMSKYEIKMEIKQQEGDPQIKGRIKQKQREMAMMRMMESVPDADVVITNPTEYAVALKYDESAGDAPMVVAKGRERIAAKIKEIAREHNVDVVEDKPLARSLFAMCEIGDFIPVELYQAVAEILAQVFRRKMRRP
jgi:flagellar biosynthetic protein FlhB